MKAQSHWARQAAGILLLLIFVLIVILVIRLSLTPKPPGASLLPSIYTPPEGADSTQSSPAYPPPGEQISTNCPPQSQWIRFEADVEVDGLRVGERGILRMEPLREEIAACFTNLDIELPKHTIGNGRHHLVFKPIPNGAYYKLEILPLSGYYRDPKGYLFRVIDGQVDRKPGFLFRYNLQLNTGYNLPACWELEDRLTPSSTSTQPPGDIPPGAIQEICRAEGLIDISSPPKQPEPNKPEIRGKISGLPEGAFLTIYIHTLDDREITTIRGQNQKTWEAVITDRSGGDYRVTIDVDGYNSQPTSYTINLQGDKAYVVRDGQVTDEEAIHLGFHFMPMDSPE